MFETQQDRVSKLGMGVRTNVATTLSRLGMLKKSPNTDLQELEAQNKGLKEQQAKQKEKPPALRQWQGKLAQAATEQDKSS